MILNFFFKLVFVVAVLVFTSHKLVRQVLLNIKLLICFTKRKSCVPEKKYGIDASERGDATVYAFIWKTRVGDLKGRNICVYTHENMLSVKTAKI